MSGSQCGATGSGCIDTVPIFSGLTNDEKNEIALITVERRYEKGQSIYLAGKSDKRLYVIHRGRVKISRVSPSGKTQVLRTLGPGDFMGELTILNDVPLQDYAEAMEDSVMCSIEGQRLKTLMQKFPSIALNILEALSSRLEKAETLIEHISLHPAEQRLAQALLEVSAGRREFDLELSKGDFASQLGMTQETLSRKLAAFQERGMIRLKGLRGIVLLDAEALETVT